MTNETCKIPDDMKATISKMIALQSLGTDPGQKIMMTASAMQWVMAGLVVKYGRSEDVPSDYQAIFEEDRRMWQDAMLKYGKGAEFWPHALLPCMDIAEDMIVIASLENMLDYRQIDFNMSVATFGPNADMIREEEMRAKNESVREEDRRRGMPA